MVLECSNYDLVTARDGRQGVCNFVPELVAILYVCAQLLKQSDGAAQLNARFAGQRRFEAHAGRSRFHPRVRSRARRIS